MRGGRVLLIAGIALVVLALGYGVYMFVIKPSTQPPPAEETPEPEVAKIEVVVAAQNIPRGMKIEQEANAVVQQTWPEDSLPVGALTDPEAVYNRIARVDIPRGMPILEGMLTETPVGAAAEGSDAALQIPEGKVAYALPVARYSSIAWALQPGDHVDVIISLLMQDLDEEFQTVPPNQATCLSPPEGEGCESGLLGRFEALPNGWLVNVLPREEQRPRLVTQLAVQDALVLQVGDWPAPGEEAVPEAEPTPTPEEEEEAPPPPPPSDRVEPLTVAVTQQEAMILDYLQGIGARINLTLRSAVDAEKEQPPTYSTESVTLQYLMDRFTIELPPKLPYGVTPPIGQLERVARDESAAQYGQPATFEITVEPTE